MSLSEDFISKIVVRKPALVVAAIQAFLALVVGFDIPLSEKKFALIMAAISTLIGILSEIFKPTASKTKRKSKPKKGTI